MSEFQSNILTLIFVAIIGAISLWGMLYTPPKHGPFVDRWTAYQNPPK